MTKKEILKALKEEIIAENKKIEKAIEELKKIKYIGINNDYKCEWRIGPKKECEEPATYVLDWRKDIYFFCEKHIKVIRKEN